MRAQCVHAWNLYIAAGDAWKQRGRSEEAWNGGTTTRPAGRGCRFQFSRTVSMLLRVPCRDRMGYGGFVALDVVLVTHQHKYMRVYHLFARSPRKKATRTQKNGNDTLWLGLHDCSS